MDSTFQSTMLQLIRDGTADMRADVSAMRSQMGNLEVRISTIENRTRSIEHVLRTHSQEFVRLSVLLEDLNDRFAAAGELHD